MYSRWDCGYPNRGQQGLPWRLIWWSCGSGFTCSWDGTPEINSRLFLLGMDTYPGSSLAPQRSEGIRKKKTHIVSRTLRLTSRINSRLFAHGLSFAMHTWERRTKAACPFPNQTRLLNKIELVYVYAYTDGEPPSQLTVSFGLLGGSYPLTIRSQSDHSPIYSPITVRSQSDHMFYYHFTLLAWKEFTDLKGDLFFPVNISSCW